MSTNLDRALLNAALPTLADPTSLASAAPGDLSFASKLFQSQLKLHLLTNEHLVLSHGFLYDNPAIWDILTPNLVQMLSSKRRDGKSTLLIQIDSEAIDGATVSAEAAFRVWAFGADGARHLEPSSLRVLGRDKRDAPATVKTLDQATATLDDYAGVLGLKNLRAAQNEIIALIHRCTVIPKADNRYEVFQRYVNSFFDLLAEAQLKGVVGPIARLYECIGPLREFLLAGHKISRSNLEAFDAGTWWTLAPYLNQLRLRCYFSADNAGFCSYYPSPADEAVSKLLEEQPVNSIQKRSKGEKWLVALDKLTLQQVFEVRSQIRFRNVLEELGEVWSEGKEDAHERYSKLLHTEWRNELVASVSAVAPNWVVDKKKGDGKWIPPVSTLSGFAAGATTLAVLGTAATAAGLTAVAVGGLVHLSLLGAKSIVDSFRVDKPEAAAHLVAGKMLDQIRKSDELANGEV